MLPPTLVSLSSSLWWRVGSPQGLGWPGEVGRRILPCCWRPQLTRWPGPILQHTGRAVQALLGLSALSFHVHAASQPGVGGGELEDRVHSLHSGSSSAKGLAPPLGAARSCCPVKGPCCDWGFAPAGLPSPPDMGEWAWSRVVV